MWKRFYLIYAVLCPFDIAMSIYVHNWVNVLSQACILGLIAVLYSKDRLIKYKDATIESQKSILQLQERILDNMRRSQVDLPITPPE
jgi:hypothetical protein